MQVSKPPSLPLFIMAGNEPPGDAGSAKFATQHQGFALCSSHYVAKNCVKYMLHARVTMQLLSYVIKVATQEVWSKLFPE